MRQDKAMDCLTIRTSMKHLTFLLFLFALLTSLSAEAGDYPPESGDDGEREVARIL